jgi:hypothetical protein
LDSETELKRSSESLHRKNVAEWVMFGVLLPFAWTGRLIAQLVRRRVSGER